MNFIKELFQSGRDRKAKALPVGFIGAVDLYTQGIIAVEWSGKSITDISAEIRSLVRVPLKAAIALGTAFVSRGSYQDMVTRRRYEFELKPLGSEWMYEIEVSCLDASLQIPDRENRFKGVAGISKKLLCFMEATDGEDAMVVQAGVWAVRGGHSREQIQSCLRIHRSSNLSGQTSSNESAISVSQMDKAKVILDSLSIPNML